MTKQKLEEKFNDFLEKEWYKDNQEVLDDDMTDAFDKWMSELDVQEVINYAMEFISTNYYPKDEAILIEKLNKVIHDILTSKEWLNWDKINLAVFVADKLNQLKGE